MLAAARRRLTTVTSVSVWRRLRSNIRPSEKFKILFFGRDEFSCQILSTLYEASDVWQEIHIATNPDKKHMRNGSRLQTSLLRQLAEDHDLPVYLLPPKEIALSSWRVRPPISLFLQPNRDPNALLVTASFGQLLPRIILNCFDDTRKLNVHPSLLPLYRGPAPIQHAIADGQEVSGVSIIDMMPPKDGADVGDVWGSKTVGIPPNANYQSLRELLAYEGGRLLVKILRQMMLGIAFSLPQDGTGASRAPLLTGSSSLIDFNTWDALKIQRVHQGMAHQKPLRTSLPSRRGSVQIIEFKIRDSRDGAHPELHSPGEAVYDALAESLIVRCAQHTEIVVTKVKQENRRCLSVKEWRNGLPAQFRAGVFKFADACQIVNSD
ncbi:Formyltransferase [Sistotremastrum suecicum HHB10207 ss-3]|uniref:methionyl-tRNA formyltransferase n=1 Tax=Sistotremastrum suecicum HHB10207 ss-3 TaxID=1314776 RepID=A0A166CGV5_9AGAM|nr:Formyltransferase [Sistotremastrum suecicum HHB10207 ss-3]